MFQGVDCGILVSYNDDGGQYLRALLARERKREPGWLGKSADQD